jgi:hypothetical protein
MFDIRSAWRGIRAMRFRNKAKWSIKWMPKSFWCHLWTPVWHEGNGPYVSCGIWIAAIYRGF